MGILDEDVARVRDATDLVALAGEHLALKRVGQRFVGLCPFHRRRRRRSRSTPSWVCYYCFGCQASGDAITFVREVEHLDFVDAVERLARACRHHAALRRHGASPRTAQRKQRLARSGRRGDRRSTTQLLLESPDGGSRARYLRSRGFDGDAARQFQLGWSPDGWDALSVHLQQKKFSRDDIVDAGLAFVNKANKLQDQFRGRLMFPIYDPRRAGRLRRPRARRRRPEVQELARDADLPEEPTALRAQLGEGARSSRGARS